MHSAVKVLIVGIAAMIAMSLAVTNFRMNRINMIEDELEYALRTACEDAAVAAMEPGAGEKFSLDPVIADRCFKESFSGNINPSSSLFLDTRIVMTGVVGFQTVSGVLNETLLAPQPYLADMGDSTYEFSTGDFVSCMKRSDETGEMETTEESLSSFDEYYFSSSLDNENYRNYIIASTAEDYLLSSLGRIDGVMAKNYHNGVHRVLSSADGIMYINKDHSAIRMDEHISEVMRGPGFFAVVDHFNPELGQSVRYLAFVDADVH